MNTGLYFHCNIIVQLCYVACCLTWPLGQYGRCLLSYPQHGFCMVYIIIYYTLVLFYLLSKPLVIYLLRLIMSLVTVNVESCFICRLQWLASTNRCQRQRMNAQKIEKYWIKWKKKIVKHPRSDKYFSPCVLASHLWSAYMNYIAE